MNRSFQNTRRTSADQAPAGWVSTDRIPASPDRISASQVLADASPDIEKQPEPERKGIFTGISPVQIAATALAALTSMFFSSIIGFTGSVIGVALGSIVSTVSTQVYKNTIAKSADKVKEKATGVFGPDGKTEVLPGIGLAESDPAETLGEHPANPRRARHAGHARDPRRTGHEGPPQHARRLRRAAYESPPW